MKKLSLFFVICLVISAVFASGLFLGQKNFLAKTIYLNNPLISNQKIKDRSLEKFTITNLANYAYQFNNEIAVEKIINDQNENFTSYLFTFQTYDRKMSGLVNIPKINKPTYPVIVLIRGWAPLPGYVSGVGTKNAANFLAKQGFVTFAPDFFGYGESDPEPSDGWEARFIKPINVIELIKIIETHPILELPSGITSVESKQTPKSAKNEDVIPNNEQKISIKLLPKKLGIWAHSNGGQIALTVLEVLKQPIPTTLWAPVTAPFPYSVLFFSDENDDEGKALRLWIAQFEQSYDVFDFSLTKHLDLLVGPLQLHHGTADDSALKSWSDDFVAKIKKENQRRKDLIKELGEEATDLDKQTLKPITINYFNYPGANHNLQPGWDQSIQRDLEFFNHELGINS